jgi:hypothetical protein
MQSASTVSFNIMATMTVAYGIGQILGPLVANSLFARTHLFDLPLAVASASLVLASILWMRQMRYLAVRVRLDQLNAGDRHLKRFGRAPEFRGLTCQRSGRGREVSLEKIESSEIHPCFARDLHLDGRLPEGSLVGA